MLADLPERRAVAKIRAPIAGGTRSGSGVLINNGFGNDGFPYMLTAAHLLDFDGDGDVTPPEGNNFEIQAEFFFGLEADCDGGNVVEPYVVEGADVLIDDEAVDLVLLRLNVTPEELIAANVNPYWVGWDLNDPLPAYVHTIHHPCCDTKMVSGGESPVDANGFTQLTGLTCGGLQEGSSGAPLFNTATGDLIGIFSGTLVPEVGPAIGADLCAGEPTNIVFGALNDFAFPWLSALDSVPPYDPGA